MQVDTSDEMLEMDYADKFIADCTEQVRRQMTPPHAEDPGEVIIRQAEAERARLFPTPGKELTHNAKVNALEQGVSHFAMHSMHSVAVDENYLVIGGYVDAILQQKIINHEYIDFVHLLPKGRNNVSEGDNRMKLVNRGGSIFFMPVADREMTGITNFSRWEQALEYSTIFTHGLIQVEPPN